MSVEFSDAPRCLSVPVYRQIFRFFRCNRGDARANSWMSDVPLECGNHGGFIQRRFSNTSFALILGIGTPWPCRLAAPARCGLRQTARITVELGQTTTFEERMAGTRSPLGSDCRALELLELAIVRSRRRAIPCPADAQGHAEWESEDSQRPARRSQIKTRALGMRLFWPRFHRVLHRLDHAPLMVLHSPILLLGRLHAGVEKRRRRRDRGSGLVGRVNDRARHPCG